MRTELSNRMIDGNQRARIQHCAGLSSTPDGRDDGFAARVPVRAKAHSRWRSQSFSKATSPPWTWRRRRLVREWRCSPNTKAVLEADGSPMAVRAALIHINKAIDDYFSEAEGDMDADTRFCIGWFQQYEFAEGPFGENRRTGRAKGTAVDGVRDAGVIHAGKGKVRLLRVKEYPDILIPRRTAASPFGKPAIKCAAHSARASPKPVRCSRACRETGRHPPACLSPVHHLRAQGVGRGRPGLQQAGTTSWPAIVEESLKTGHKGSQMSLL